MLEEGNKFYSYFDYYNEEVKPRLMSLDLLLKENQNCICKDEFLEILDLEEDEFDAIMFDNRLIELNPKTSLQVIEAGSSELCRLIKREIKAGLLYTYTPNDIAYIYDLNEREVNNAFMSLKIKEATALTIPLILSEIPFRNCPIIR